jgi:hypothetical protein
MQTFELCRARYKAENIDRARGIDNDAAMLGSSVHGGLEEFVKTVYVDGSAQPSLSLLLMFYKASYMKTFGTSDTDTVEYMEGYDMTTRWYERTVESGYFQKITGVVSVEVKSFFEVPTSLGPLPWNYIWDRFDQIDDRRFKVVDYKTNRWDITSNDLTKKIQARAYGLACAIQLKSQGIDYDEIWVEFDMLRHSGPRGIMITREQNASMWARIKHTAQEIVDTPTHDDEGNEIPIPETLNDMCGFCVRKVSCKALAANIAAGGIMSVPNVEAAIDLRAFAEYQKKGLDSLIKDLDKKIIAESKKRDQIDFESDLHTLEVGLSRGNRDIDSHQAEKVIGAKLFDKYGKKGLPMTVVDKLLKGDELDAQQKAQLRGLIFNKPGSPKVTIKPKSNID